MLGLVTEVNKLSRAERQQVFAWAAEDIGGKVPLAVTVAEPSVRAQQEFVKFAEDQGADWVILRPPPVKGAPEAEYIRFFGAVAAAAKIPVAIACCARWSAEVPDAPVLLSGMVGGRGGWVEEP